MFLSKGTVFINAATHRLEPCNLVRKELAQISRRKYPKILKFEILKRFQSSGTHAEKPLWSNPFLVKLKR